MIVESENESENDQERQKIKKVLSLIQTLTSLSDRQQMAEQLLDKYEVICDPPAQLLPLLLFILLSSSYAEFSYLSSLSLDIPSRAIDCQSVCAAEYDYSFPHIVTIKF